MSLTYREAGVDIDKGDELVKRIGPMAATTHRPEVVGSVGGFAGLCALPSGYRDPVLVSGTDGVGTKLAVAHAVGSHRGIGIDLVAMAVNDVITVGAEPLFFLDYFATSALDVELALDVIAGIVEGCKQAGCALLGGETAELPGLYRGKDYDLAGFCVGVVERDAIITGEAIESGDVIIGLPSAGLHSNGFSLARHALFEELGLALEESPEALAGTLGDELLRPTVIYVEAVRRALGAGIEVRGLSHITGGGLIENPPRMLGTRQAELTVALDPATWTRPAIFDLVASAGVSEEEMRRTFNLGIGMLVVVPPGEERAAIEALGTEARVVGAIEARSAAAVVFAGD